MGDISRREDEMISPSCFGMLFRRCRDVKKLSNNVNKFKNLSSIPNRVCSNGKSKSSSVFTQQGRKGVNQDAMIVWEDFMSEDTIFCGVFDGHGPYGHLVARRVRDKLPLKLMSLLRTRGSVQNGHLATCCNAKDVVDPDDSNVESSSIWGEAFLKAYKSMDKELRTHPNLDCFCSGSTAITILKQGLNLYIGYIGDSRAILGSRDIDGSISAFQLSVDLKPNLPREAERIKQCKGRVFAMEDEPEVTRVWLPFDDAPGLAMARAFGDFCLKDYGVISTPEFYHRVLNEQDEFVVLASDGVWDVLSNEEVANIVASVPNRSSAAKTVVESAAREWKTKYPTSKMDDCAVVCLFLDGKMDSNECDDQIAKGSDESEDEDENEEQSRSMPSLQRNCTVRCSEENDPYKEVTERAAEDKNWSGLEGVTRVNSLVQLPRFSDEQPRT
ncbi:probable protein phosphatase 2C 52 [Impatiens glandulifera]|uniref:probable protein phosphatase 2C 52 n=1 Tax=Impatiens glandulifera TaxID=253017 RepID=UPI001FB0BEE5|nr:probable protein phosphatase 2C 52 [Impatiens glandulifera]